MRVRPKLKIFISALLIIAVISPAVMFSSPRQAEAQAAAAVAEVGPFSWISKALLKLGVSQQTITALIKGKEWAWHIVEELAKAAAMKALQEITKSTVAWINSGYHGSPLFLENPESFFKDIEKFEIRTLVDLYGYDQLKYPFGRDFALNTIYAYNSRLAENSAYSLSNYIQDPVLLRNYQTDFNVGGWSGFLINTQYPQNNYIGFQILANETLAGKIAGEAGSAKNKVATLLDQGMGFLSPQICQTNDKYNNLSNEFKQPTFKTTEDEEAYVANCDSIVDEAQFNACLETGYAEYDEAVAEEKVAWEKDNTCPPREGGASGFVSTTPGSVVANQIIKSVQSPTTLKELAVNSGTTILSAVFDQLLTKLFEKGISALSGSKNNPPDDDWNYNGLILGGDPATVTGYDEDIWDTPDEIVTVSDFNLKLDVDIKKTEEEIKYMTNGVPDSFGPGTMQAVAQIWPKIQQLDVCQPGPDVNWENRFDREMATNQTKFSSGSSATSTTSEENSRELEFAASMFKDWMETQIKYILPSSPSFMAAIDDLPDLEQLATQVESKIDSKQDAMSQLNSIKNELASLPPEPAEDSPEEDKLFSLWTQYKALVTETSNDITLGEARRERDSVLSKKSNLDALITKCGEERGTKGWATQGGAGSLHSSGATEQVYFCDAPIVGGYTHKNFVNSAAAPAYPQIPLVNTNVSGVNVSMNCSTIFNANVLDYKGNLPSF